MNNSSDCKYHQPDTSMTTAFKVTVFVLVGVLGIFGNVFAILLATKYTVRKNLHHLIVNMAVSDTLFIVMMSFFVTQHLSKETFSLYPGGLFGSILCKSSFFLVHVSCPVSFVTLLIISIERFRITRMIVNRARPYTLYQRGAVLISSWLIPMILFGFVLHYANLSVRLSSNVHVCRISPSKYALLWFFINQNLTVILFIVIFVLSILTIRKLSETRSFQANFNEAQQKLRVKRIRSAVNMVLFSLLVSCSCWLPYFIYSFLFYLEVVTGKKTLGTSLCIDWSSLHFIIVYFLPIINSSISPAIYIVFLSDFRDASKKFLCRKRIRKQGDIRNSFELRPLSQKRHRRRSGRRDTSFIVEQDIRTTRTSCG